MASTRLLSPILALAFLPALAGPAAAQTVGKDRSFDVQLFQPAVGRHRFITLDSARVPGHKQFNLSLSSIYQHGAFSIFSEREEMGEVETTTVDVVENQFMTELSGAVGLGDRFEVGLAIPLTLRLRGQDFNEMGQPAGADITGAGIGDVRLEGKVELATFGSTEEFTISVAPGITLPTGDENKFLGDKSVTGRLRGLLEFRPIPEFRAGAMAGLLFRQESKTFDATVGNQLLYGLAAEYNVHKQVGLLGELLGRSGLSEFSEFWKDANPVEVDAAMRVRLPKQVSVALGAGTGLVNGIGAPKYRAFLTVGWEPDFRDRDGDGVPDLEDRCPDEPEDQDGYRDSDGCPEPDNDNDNFLDAQDRCPTEAEDYDQFKDEDGCPDPDNDGDGVEDLKDPCPNAAEDGGGKRPKDGCPTSVEDQDGDGVSDGKDKCPDEPEDRDGFEDEDGCPELDNDDDSIPDNFDGCPSQAEDADGFDDTDGCPDPDNDKDGILDARDKCPGQPETLNGSRDDDGCPDAGAEIVKLTPDEIEVRDRLAFTMSGGKPAVTSGGAAIVNMVAMVLKGHQDVARVRIDVSGEGLTKEDAQARAEAVQAALVAKGIDPGRLKANGLGAGPNKVQFIIEAREELKNAAPTGPAAPTP